MATISFARGAPSLDIVDVEGLQRGRAARLRERPGGDDGLRHVVGYVPLREWIAEQHGVEPSSRCWSPTARCRPTRSCSSCSCRPGDAVIVESPTYDRTLLNLRNRGADVRMVDLETDGISIDGLGDGALDGGAPEARAHHPELPEPGRLHALRGQAQAAAGARGRARLHDLRGRPVRRRSASRASTIASMFSQDDAGRVVYASSFSKTVCPGIRVGYLVGPQAIIKQIQTIATNTYISPNMVAQSIVNQFARSGRHGRRDRRRSRPRCAPAATRSSPRSQREIPEAKFAAPSGGYFMWVELPEGVDVAELEKAAAERDVLFVKGTDFLLEGGQNTLRLAYSGVTPGADRRGHHEARRGRSLPWRRGITTATTPRSTACCTARGRSRCSSTAGSGRPSTASTLMDALARGPRRARLGGVEHRVPAARQRRRRAGRRSTTCAPRSTTSTELPGVDLLAGGDDRPQRRRASRGVGGDARESARGGHRRRLPGGRAGPRSARRSCGSPTASSTAS